MVRFLGEIAEASLKHGHPVLFFGERERFLGEIAEASLKREAIGRLEANRAGFLGEIAEASLKPQATVGSIEGLRRDSSAKSPRPH